MSNITSQNRIAYQIDNFYFPLEITSSPILSDGTVRQTYTHTLEANLYPVTWSISDGTLPAGLTLDADTGIISGTPTKAGEYKFTVDIVSGDSTDSKEFTIRIYVAITTEKLSVGAAPGFYKQKLKANDTATWNLSNGNLPTGLTLSSDGVISGTATEIGTYTFTVAATNNNGGTLTTKKDFTVKIVERDDSIPVVSAVWTAENLPAGLMLSSSGVLTGTPTETGTSDSIITVKTNWGKASRTVKIKVLAAS